MKQLLITFLLLSALANTSCKKLKKPEAATERETWIASFNDSIQYYNVLLDDINKNLNDTNREIAIMMEQFEYVSNPRQVTGYYILKGWNSKLPFTQTAIYSRITDDEKLEIIATLSSGIFNKIMVESDNNELTSQTVPHDQALNYRHSNYNTVCFSGAASDSIADFISSHKNEKIKLFFLNGSNKKDFVIPDDEKSMISKTWELFSAQLEQKRLQKELWINSRKIDACRRMLEKADSIKQN